MIGNINRKTGGLGSGFKGLLSYLETGKDGKQIDRIDWVESRNLGTERLDVAGRIMAATARESVRTEKPVFHFSVSFAPEDPVTRELMQKVADGVLRDLGLQEHQALIVAHKDTGQAHMHVVVNRVHPDEHRAWKPSWTKERIEASMRRQEVAHGLRIVPGRLAPVPHREGAERVSPAPRLQRGDAAFLEDVKARACPVFERARSWGELENGLAEVGLRVRMNGRGMSVADNEREVKASDLSPDRRYSRHNVEKRLGAHSAYRARVAVAEAPPAPGRSPGRGTETTTPSPGRERAPATTAAPHSGRNAESSPADRVFWRAYARFKGDLEKLYADPVEARRAILREADRGAPARAAAEVRTLPEKYGRLVAEDGARAHLADRAARSAAAFVEARADRPRGTLKDLAAATDARVRHDKRQATVSRTADAAGRATSDQRAAKERHAYSRATASAAAKAMGQTYADPQRAGRRIMRAMRRNGVDSVVAQVREQPERFGELRGVRRLRLGFWREVDTSQARASAPRTAQALETAAAARQAAPSRRELNALSARVERTQRDHHAARAALAAGPSRRAIDAEIGSLVQRAAVQAQKVATGTLGPLAAGPQKLLEATGIKHIQQFAAMVKAPQLAVARAAWDLAQKLARGEQGRDGTERDGR